jgi:ABC-2 type transport system ATP-binding protein
MSEVAETAEQVVVIGRGRLIADTSVAQLVDTVAEPAVRVRTPDRDRLRELLERPGTTLDTPAPDTLVVRGLPVAEVGEVARRHGIGLHALTEERPSLEDAFLALTRDAVEFDAGAVSR